ncbi:hypothetical protein BDQ17DRAFT_366395 [Cyathus striatus]|nr:hypothetical protein BDQ17DRAFT_953727 [Cyathus striatus]KAF8990544.1 hypothetical protein BDQ17DRAFT_366395 [Cyathus striatus]
MPNKQGNSGKSSSKSDSGPSDYAIHKSYGGWPNFMHSHGLKTYNSGDVAEGKAITASYRQHDSSNASQSQSSKGKK